MKDINEIYSDCMITLWELENTNPEGKTKEYLQIKLEVLYDILGDYIEEDFWDRIEEQIHRD